MAGWLWWLQGHPGVKIKGQDRDLTLTLTRNHHNHPAINDHPTLLAVHSWDFKVMTSRQGVLLIDREIICLVTSVCPSV